MLLTLSILCGLTIVVSGCNMPRPEPTGDPLATAAAETVSVRLTAAVISTEPPPVDTPTKTNTAAISATATDAPSATPIATEDCENKASFVSDVTIPDDTNIPAGEEFTKTWRIRNSGTCTWDPEYDLVFDSGNIMGGPTNVSIPAVVAPNDTVDLSVTLQAPNSPETYRGNWKLRTPEGLIFGIGANADKPFFVQIVVGPTPTPKPSSAYNFVDSYCDAEWRSGAGVLPCPGDDTDATGFVVKLDSPTLENGAVENEAALFTHPEWVNNGVVTGKFPAFDVEDGDTFLAVIGCLQNGFACNVRFQLNYRADGGSLQNLAMWDEQYDGNIQAVELDLSSLSGKSVEFVLAVQANGAANQDWAFWLQPRIVR
jgi:hypothetical protein